MNQSPIIHDSFTLERVFDAPPARVFEALARPELKARWFVGPPSWREVERAQDFRVGGRERVHGVHAGGLTSVFDAYYLDIVPDQRVVYVYEMTVGGRKISASLATLELLVERGATRLRLTEQGAYFADPDQHRNAPQGQNASRRLGTEGLLDQLVALFAR